ncbi:SPW repeat domain-containing protein [Siccirubricoccus deserti]|uniref:SPW repeat protein n=1 Tax=Siccirubricoccus deserti TaxID=2013562 RepID=A0A9X0UG00_9PROT|nr:SPW repeat protein [Siccirubricoccus deserti]MBC4018506.1 SPW repeat protein [Siccirubricoccus deserti]
MRFISTRTHGVIDYLMGALLIVAPYILGFADGTAAQWIPQIVGAVLIGAALMTDYELGAVRMIPMPVHLFLDVAAGALLAVSPWLFGFADRVFWPHLILGLLEIGAGLMTRTTPETAAATATGHATTVADRHH